MLEDLLSKKVLVLIDKLVQMQLRSAILKVIEKRNKCRFCDKIVEKTFEKVHHIF